MTQAIKHTPHPSPWLVLDDGQTVDGGLTIVSVSHDGFRVAHVNPDVGDGYIHCAANAALIAAAPETAAERDRLKAQLRRVLHIILTNHEAGEAVKWAQGLHLHLTGDQKTDSENAFPDYDANSFAKTAAERDHLKALNDELAGALENLLNEGDNRIFELSPVGQEDMALRLNEARAVLAKHNAGGQ